jgi:peptidoglycan/xylan/chitin deacetylase (PgdA/CDA1 family)
MTRRGRQRLLRLLRALGGFAVARRLTFRGLRIVCYHGVSLDDEHVFRPHLFIQDTDLARRLAYLTRKGFRVLALDDALARLDRDELPVRAVVVTFDDGFYSTFSKALPLLARLQMPATLYLSTYYVTHQQPLYNLAIPYLFWKTSRSSIDLDGLDLPASIAQRFPWKDMTRDEQTAVIEALVAHGDTGRRPAEREQLLRDIARRLSVDPETLFTSRPLGFVNADEVRLLQAGGVGIELHTHRHRSPGVREEALRELLDNRTTIESIIGRSSVHFCYPSGQSVKWEAHWLSELGIHSATTIESGFNYRSTPRFHLHRFLDSSAVSQIEFEAELSGVFEIARWLKSRWWPDERVSRSSGPRRERSTPPPASNQSLSP